MDLRKRKREKEIPRPRKYLLRQYSDDRDGLDLLYQHFTNYGKYYVKDDIRINSFNDLYRKRYNEEGDEFINNLIKTFKKMEKVLIRKNIL